MLECEASRAGILDVGAAKTVEKIVEFRGGRFERSHAIEFAIVLRQVRALFLLHV
jgi:hypothetical protein